MGSSGIRRRKRCRRLPKVRADLDGTTEPNQATPLSPMGAVQAYGDIFRAAQSPNQRQRRAGMPLGVMITLPFV